MDDSFWALEQTKQNYIKIHLARCHCCKNRDVIRTNSSHHWHGPFATYADVRAWTATTRRPVDDCKFCNPQCIR